MIKLDKIILNNVGPYRYEKGSNQAIEITDNYQSDYIFLHAAPTHGKTTFRNALSWLLCNRFSDSANVGKSSGSHEVADFINQNCVTFPDHEFFVKGELVDDIKNLRYVITKTINLVQNKIKNVDDLRTTPPQVSTHVKVINLDDQTTSLPDKPEEFLSNLFPSRLLDYFFVSGNDVRDRLLRKDLASDFETILGLGAFSVLNSVLKKIKDETSSRNAKHEKADSAQKALDNEKEKIKRELNGDEDTNSGGKIKDLQDTQAKIKDYVNQRDTAINELRKYDECSKIAQDRDKIQDDIEELQLEIKDNALWLQEKSSSFWAIFAYNHIIEPLEETPSLYKSADQEFINVMDNIITKQSPSHIFNKLDDSVQNTFIEIFNNHKDKIDVDSSNIASFDVYKGTHNTILKKTLEISRNNSIIKAKKTDLALKTTQIQNTPFKDPNEEKEAKAAQRKLEGIESLISSLQDKEKRLSGEIEAGESRLAEIEDEMAKYIVHLSDDEKKLYDTACFLIPIVEKSLDSCKKEYRHTFEKKANQIFEVIKNPKNPNDSLKINDDYYMSIYRPGLKDRDNNETKILERKRKSGSEGFVAATAVTLALSQLAIKNFPVVLDTPFEQGDINDDLRLIEGWKTINQQAIISFQSDSLPDDSPLTYQNLKKKFPISKHYKIHKDPQKEMSWFEELK